MLSLIYQLFDFALKSSIATAREGFFGTKLPNSFQGYRKFFQTHLVSGHIKLVTSLTLKRRLSDQLSVNS